MTAGLRALCEAGGDPSTSGRSVSFAKVARR